MLGEMVVPAHTALLTMEMQRGTVGDLSVFPALARAVERSNIVESTAALLHAARAAEVQVVHCTAGFRSDGLGAKNAPILAMRPSDRLLRGSPDIEVLPEFGPDASDIVSSRSHGVSPFTGTSLDVTLRHCGVQTVVVAGVSLNLALLGLCIEAVNLGYTVVVPTDCVIGLPAEYGNEVLNRTVALVATLCSSDDLLEAWQLEVGVGA